MDELAAHCCGEMKKGRRKKEQRRVLGSRICSG
jgi:hypothetical protein